MQVPVYEITQYNGAQVTWTAHVVAGQVSKPRYTVKFYGQTGHASNDKRTPQPLPCNYNTIDNTTLKNMLTATQYGYMYVSELGKLIANKIGA